MTVQDLLHASAAVGWRSSLLGHRDMGRIAQDLSTPAEGSMLPLSIALLPLGLCEQVANVRILLFALDKVFSRPEMAGGETAGRELGKEDVYFEPAIGPLSGLRES